MLEFVRYTVCTDTDSAGTHVWDEKLKLKNNNNDMTKYTYVL